ncbi:hypothetical protein RFEPED_1591 [Rickettsia felis str. Pedreira]|uniref:Uncharacterized protein n=1 Tax=Rickettsia felis str. Pedreira TaxID=1359196 RepID=A0A0F3MTX7_RICFI|nr:hypothetical protein [Rickettsia felis]KJV59190.1 hypothetical protein RFEPED_1591 [Rickettsia felis str. Pedreira]
MPAWINFPSLRGGFVAWTGKCSLCHSCESRNPEKIVLILTK